MNYRSLHLYQFEEANRYAIDLCCRSLDENRIAIPRKGIRLESPVVLGKWKSCLQCSLWSQFLPAMHLSNTAKLRISA